MGTPSSARHGEALVAVFQTLLNIVPQIVSPFGRSTLSFHAVPVIPIGIDSADDGYDRQQDRHQNHHRGRDPALEGNRARGLRNVGDSVVFERQQRLGLRSRKALLAQGRVLGAECVDLALEAGDFSVLGHAGSIAVRGTKRKHCDGESFEGVEIKKLGASLQNSFLRRLRRQHST